MCAKSTSKKKNKKDSQMMGLSQALITPDRVFPRVFRFILKSELEEIDQFVKKVSVNMETKKLTISLYDAEERIWLWVKNMMDGATDQMKLTALSGIGETIYELNFKDATFDSLADNVFNYAKNDIVVHKISLISESVERTDYLNTSG